MSDFTGGTAKNAQYIAWALQEAHMRLNQAVDYLENAKTLATLAGETPIDNIFSLNIDSIHQIKLSLATQESMWRQIQQTRNEKKSWND